MFLIVYRTPSGEEREERWASPDAFRAWAQGQGLPARFTAYRQDEDGDWLRVLRGRVDGGDRRDDAPQA